VFESQGLGEKTYGSTARRVCLVTTFGEGGAAFQG